MTTHGIQLSAVFVSQKSVRSEEPYDIIFSNIEFVNLMFDRFYLEHEEFHPLSLMSYYTDYYDAQVKNGGIKQFIRNSRWSLKLIRFVQQGLQALNHDHARLFNSLAEWMVEFQRQLPEKADLVAEILRLEGGKEYLDNYDKHFFARPDLVEIHSHWLKGLPELQTFSKDTYRDLLRAIKKSIPDFEARQQSLLDAEPQHLKDIRAFCAKQGHRFETLTIAEELELSDGEPAFVLFFKTDKGVFGWVEGESKRQIINEEDLKVVFEIEGKV